MATTVLGSAYKISGGTQIVAVLGFGGSAVYTVPSNSFFILSATSSAGTQNLTFSCRLISIPAYANFPGGIYIGPGESIVCSNPGLTQNAYLIGVLYTNN